ncbi:MAG: hypothetical protein M3N82_18190 [Pseudomonadota bacterium]|nr:hypothetical protein [Pseudomonadota bacterium]
MNSRNALRNAQALAGSCAFARAVPLCLGRSPDHRESEDRPDPGGSRV